MTGRGSHDKRGFSRYNKVRNPQYDWLRYSKHGWQRHTKKNTGNCKASCFLRKCNKLNVRPGCTEFTMQVMITPLQLSHVTSVYGFICNSRTWQNDMPAYTELTLQIIMTSSQLCNVNSVYVFFTISVNSIATDIGVMTHQHTLDLPSR